MDNHSVCELPRVAERVFDEGVDPFRMSLIRNVDKKWVNGTTLRYFFFDDGAWKVDEYQADAIRQAFNTWKNIGIGLDFKEVFRRENAEIRIGYVQGGGSWSYVGRDIIDIMPDVNMRTMNFGWNLTTSWGRDTALHEIGHTLGFPHEHQNPNSGIVWDRQAVLDSFSNPPNNWSEEKIEFNILRKLPKGSVSGSKWDRNSIMHYQFSSGLILKPQQFKDNPLVPLPGLSQLDKDEVQKFYPPISKKEVIRNIYPYISKYLSINPGEQIDLAIKPPQTRQYTIQTFGKIDCVMVLFEHVNGEPKYIDGDDDSGYDTNAKIKVTLKEGINYTLKLRLYYKDDLGEFAIMYW